MKNLVRHLLWRREQQRVDARVSQRLDRLKSVPSAGRQGVGVDRLNRLLSPAPRPGPRLIELSDKLS
ncbi:MAG: hypothetical protein AAGD47_09910 [Pseudomonadota bacterium]